MAITLADFTKIWASTSPLTPYSFSESNYKEGWNFIGGTPPSRQMWDSIQNQNDEKLKYIVDNFLPLDGGTMTGAIVGNPLTLTADDGNGNSVDLVLNANGTATWNSNLVDPIVLQAGTSDTGGYCVRYESGLQVCWGGEASNTSGKQITFLYPFVASPRIVSGVAGSNVYAWISDDSTTGFKMISASATPWHNWLAIGRWK